MEPTKKEIDIVMLAYLRHEFTVKSLRYIVERTSTPYRLTLVVNGTSQLKEDELKIYRALLDVGTLDHLIEIRNNYGVHAGKNVALPLVHSFPYYIDLDNDILVPDLDGKDWLGRLTDLMDNNPEYGSVSLRPQVLVGRSGKEFDVEGDVVEFSHIGAHGRIMRSDVVKKVGGWEKTWNALRNHEDRWIAKKLAEEGYKSGYAKNLRCWHMFGDDTSDPWGYPADQKPEDHGHREIWPPVNKYADIKNFDKKTWQPTK